MNEYRNRWWLELCTGTCITGERLHVWCRKDAGSSTKLVVLFTQHTQEKTHTARTCHIHKVCVCVLYRTEWHANHGLDFLIQIHTWCFEQIYFIITLHTIISLELSPIHRESCKWNKICVKNVWLYNRQLDKHLMLNF